MSILSNHFPEVLDELNDVDPRDLRPAEDDPDYLEFVAYIGELQDKEEELRWSDPLYFAEMERASVLDGEAVWSTYRPTSPSQGSWRPLGIHLNLFLEEGTMSAIMRNVPGLLIVGSLFAAAVGFHGQGEHVAGWITSGLACFMLFGGSRR